MNTNTPPHRQSRTAALPNQQATHNHTWWHQANRLRQAESNVEDRSKGERKERVQA